MTSSNVLLNFFLTFLNTHLNYLILMVIQSDKSWHDDHFSPDISVVKNAVVEIRRGRNQRLGEQRPTKKIPPVFVDNDSLLLPSYFPTWSSRCYIIVWSYCLCIDTSCQLDSHSQWSSSSSRVLKFFSPTWCHHRFSAVSLGFSNRWSNNPPNMGESSLSTGEFFRLKCFFSFILKTSLRRS